MSDEKVVLITGGGTGIGKACALKFAESGYNVIVNYSRSESEASATAEAVKQIGTNGVTMQCDISDEAAVREMMNSVESQFGRLDALVNNAGFTSFIDHTDLDAMSEELWDKILGVNLKGPFFCMRAARKLLNKDGGGTVVNVSSVAGITGRGSSIAYCASKGALNTLTKSMARAMAPNIQVNAVCPGPVDSRWLQRVMNEEELMAMTQGYPIPRPATPEDIAESVIYLATRTALTTGQLLVVDGGNTM